MRLNDFLNGFGPTYREIRDRKRMNDSEVAKAIPVDRSTICKAKKGIRRLSRETVERVAEKGLKADNFETDILLLEAGYAPQYARVEVIKGERPELFLVIRLPHGQATGPENSI